MKKRTIILTGGGTAGHITPLLAVARKLHEKAPDIRLVYVIERGNPNEHLVVESGVPLTICRIFAGKLRRYHGQRLLSRLFDIKTNLLNGRDFFYTSLGFWQSVWVLLRVRPIVVFSKGGYVSVPIGLAAALLRKPLVTHDSDSVPGLANRVAGKFAVKNAVGSHGYAYPYKPERIVFTGVPVSDEYMKRANGNLGVFKADIGLPKNADLLFIGGGSQGARAIDDVVETIARPLLEKYPHLYIVHSFGRLNESTMENRYRDLPENIAKRLIKKGFLSDQYRYVAAADIVISRAGATATAEYGVLGKACIIIPAAHLTGGHQIHNARALEEKNAVIVISENEAPQRLGESIEYLLQHKSERKKLGETFRSVTPNDAADKLADVILGEAE